MNHYTFSMDIWDYLEDMPYMPSRADRDGLIAAAQIDERQAKRVKIWDYFFRIRPADLGRPQKQEIDRLQRQKRGDDDSARLILTGTVSLAALLALVGLLKKTEGVLTQDYTGLLLFVTGSLVIIAACFWYDKRRVLLEYEFQKAVSQLNQEITNLKHHLPIPPDSQQVYLWLQDDIRELNQQAIDRTGLAVRLIPLKDIENPLCIPGPAKLQENIPAPFLNKEDDRWKHLRAYDWATLQNGSFHDFYGVYRIEFILVADDMLGSYGCFFDFITGKLSSERTSEQYYRDVVALRIRHDYREIEVGAKSIVIENAPTFSMSLTSGEQIEVTFASREYFVKISQQPGTELIPFDPERWTTNPEFAVDNAIKALRLHLRKHKSLPEEAAAT